MMFARCAGVKPTDNAFIEAMSRATVGVKVILGKDNNAT
jgi:hypothetical protein